MSKEFTSVGDLLKAITADIKAGTHHAHGALRSVGDLIEESAKSKIGTYQSATGPFPAWQPLAESTINAKNSALPLYVDGTLRDAIEHTVDGDRVYIGVKSHILHDGKTDIADVAVWQELGTQHIPPRPFIGPALHENREEVGHILLLAVTKLMKAYKRE